MRYVLKLAIEPIGDLSHRINNDLRLSLGDVCWWGSVLALMIPWTASYGPFHGAVFFRQVQESAEEHMKTASAQDPLFQSLLPAIVRDRGEAEAIHDPRYGARVWDALATSGAVTNKGPYTCATRFFSVRDCAKYWDGLWHTRLLLQTFWALRDGMMDGAAASKTAVLKGLSSFEPQAKPTAKEQQHKSNKIRALGKNSLHTSTIILGESGLQRRVRIMLNVGKQMRAYHSEHSSVCNSVADCQKWCHDEAAGHCLDHIFGMFAPWQSGAELDFIGFSIAFGGVNACAVPPRLLCSALLGSAVLCCALCAVLWSALVYLRLLGICRCLDLTWYMLTAVDLSLPCHADVVLFVLVFGFVSACLYLHRCSSVCKYACMHVCMHAFM